ncbi:MAG: hypothetical protein ABJ308_04550 [Halieaceae bacterium]
MQRVFYYSGYRMKVFEWDDKRLLGCYEFEPDEDGFGAFEQFLQEAIPLPARLLVDMIEEDFRRENIPHVSARDRKSLVHRLIERHYRDEPYVHAKVLGRSSAGRRDDQVLMSALTNMDVLNPWLESMDEYEVTLAGIWSLPLITQRLLKPLRARAENSLVVTRQIRSTLRNSYFRNSKLLLSRQVRFDKEVWEQDSTELWVDHLQRGAREVFNFLTNQRVIEPGDSLQVYCVVPESQLDEARDLVSDSNEIRYELSGLEQLLKAFKLKGIEGQGTDALFAYICSSEPLLRDHYGTNEQKRRFNHYYVDRFITQVEEIGTLLFVTAAVLLALNSMQLGRQVNALDYATNQAAAQYNSDFGGIEEQLNSAVTVRDTVLTVAEFKAEAARAPQALFGPVGRVLGDPRFAALQLQRLEWQKYSGAEALQLLDSHRAQTATADNPYQEDYGYDQYDEYGEDLGAADARRAVLHLKGYMNTEGLSYTNTQDRMHAVAEQLQNLAEVQEVMLIRMPADVRPQSRFTDQVGRVIQRDSAAEEKDRFELLLLLEDGSRA